MAKNKINQWTLLDRRNDLKNQIRNVGISRLPSYPELGKKYGVGRSMICKDISKIVSEMDTRELDETFTDFYQMDLAALSMLRNIIQTGSNSDKIRAVGALVNLQKGATDLLETFGKKQKIADRLEVATVNYSFKMEKPFETELSKEEPIEMNEERNDKKIT